VDGDDARGDAGTRDEKSTQLKTQIEMMRALSSTTKAGVTRAIEEAREKAATLMGDAAPARVAAAVNDVHEEGASGEGDARATARTMAINVAKAAPKSARDEDDAGNAGDGANSKKATYCVEHYDMDVKYEGLVIGPGGATIRKLQQDIGTSIEVVRGEGKLQIKGSREKIEYARKMLDEFFEQKGSKTVKVSCKARSGLIIGNAGQTIKALKEQTGCRIEVMRDVEECVITGPGDRVKVAQTIVEKMIADSWEEGADGDITIVEEVIPCAYKAGAIIGPGGGTIRHIRETTGVAIDIERGADGCKASDQCRVIGTPAQVKKAVEIVHQLLKEMNQAQLQAAPVVPPMYAYAYGAVPNSYTAGSGIPIDPSQMQQMDPQTAAYYAQWQAYYLAQQNIMAPPNPPADG
jgi:polyribonucleotide nucleotidyltransferase